MKFKIYFLFVLIFLSSCVNDISIGIPHTYNGHYRSRNYILNNDNFLFIRVFEGGLTIYFADENEVNIQGLGYTSISGFNVTGYSENMYAFETANMSGIVTFNGDKYSTITFSKFTSAPFSISKAVLDKINSF
ncbi:hypothetical protein [Brachyspira aalborgi]|jgi:hypothetical protein|uniref:Lipoprotein n=1 Tax=Brachyspira aalborgi TaxID=29522 RepID=A0ABY3K5W2_9SPIR|nr:hypothetical protein [Brachyspira aalborgi]MBS4762880.1 hypothetical protein [Brachyspira sp.]TXJ30622.1 hypothetical protein EPJ71_11790 [Brachyspira aalborgi]CCY74599.1 putative uncharacterized protein [Brachyspira sp. CAG:700]